LLRDHHRGPRRAARRAADGDRRAPRRRRAPHVRPRAGRFLLAAPAARASHPALRAQAARARRRSVAAAARAVGRARADVPDPRRACGGSRRRQHDARGRNAARDDPRRAPESAGARGPRARGDPRGERVSPRPAPDARAVDAPPRAAAPRRGRRTAMSTRWTRVTLGALLVAAALASGCSHDATNAEATARVGAEPVAIAVAPATIAQVERSVPLVGAFFANEEVALSAQVEARVAGIGPDMGDVVQQGDVLVKLDDADLQASFREIQARLVKARADNARAEVLRGQGIMATEEADKMRTEAAVLEAQLDVVRVKIDRTVIRAPFTGVIAERTTSVGAVVKI